MNALLRLELRRNFSFFIALAVLYVLSVPAAWIYAGLHAGGQPPIYSAYGALYFWALPGVLLAQLLFGIVAALRNAEAAVAADEDAIPLSPRRRACAGLAAAVIYGLLFALLVWGGLLCGMRFRMPHFSLIHAVMPLLAVYLSVVSYACAFAFRNGAWGALAQAGLLFLLSLPLAGGFFSAEVYGGALDYGVMLYLTVGLSLAGALAMLALRSHTLALKPVDAARRNLLAAVLLLGGPCIGGVVAGGQLYWGERRLVPLKPYTPPGMDMQARPPVPGGGIILVSARGEAALARPDGRIMELFPPSVTGFIHLPRYGAGRILDMAYDSSGVLWAALRDGGEARGYEVWRIEPSGGRKNVASFGGEHVMLYGFWFMDGKPQLLAMGGPGNIFRTIVAPLGAESFKPQWRVLSAEEIAGRGYAAGETVRFESERGVSVMVGGKKRVFGLPVPRAAGVPMQHPSVLATGDRVAFSAYLQSAGGDFSFEYRMLVCGADGRCSAEPGGDNVFLPHDRFGYADARYIGGKSGSFYFAPDKTTLFGPVELGPAIKEVTGSDRKAYVFFLRARNKEADLLVEGRWLARVNMADGRLLARRELPVRGGRGRYVRDVCAASEEGFFFYAVPDLYFVRWNGAVTKVG